MRRVTYYCSDKCLHYATCPYFRRVQLFCFLCASIFRLSRAISRLPPYTNALCFFTSSFLRINSTYWSSCIIFKVNWKMEIATAPGTVVNGHHLDRGIICHSVFLDLCVTIGLSQAIVVIYLSFKSRGYACLLRHRHLHNWRLCYSALCLVNWPTFGLMCYIHLMCFSFKWGRTGGRHNSLRFTVACNPWELLGSQGPLIWSFCVSST